MTTVTITRTRPNTSVAWSDATASQNMATDIAPFDANSTSTTSTDGLTHTTVYTFATAADFEAFQAFLTKHAADIQTIQAYRAANGITATWTQA